MIHRKGQTEETGQLQKDLGDSRRTGMSGEDLTGRDRLVSNVLFNWGAYSVFIIAGFIMPRMIDSHLGQESLGVWDFAWSLVSYFGLVQMGVSSSVNRYVAKYRAAGDISGLNAIVSSATCILGISGLLVMGMTITVSLLLPRLFGSRLGENAEEAQWVVLFLGASLGVQISSSTFSGVLTGCHRWDLHNINTSGWYAVTVAGMIIALLCGCHLWVLAAITFAGESLSAIRRTILACAVCEGLRPRMCLAKWTMVGELLVFGGKALVPSVSSLLLNQTTGILIMMYLGPASLALYSRPRSLLHQMNTLMNKMAMLLVPTISSLQSAGDVEGVRELLVRSVRYSCYLALPMVMLLVVFGDGIMQLWMGPRYSSGLVPAILAIGYLAYLVQAPVLMVLLGMNAHGRAGIYQLIASICSVALTFLALKPLGWGVAGAAIAVGLPLTVANAVCLPLFACRQVGLGASGFYLSVVAGPAALAALFLACLLAGRLVFQGNSLKGLLSGGVVGGTLLAVLYWRYVLPDGMRAAACRLLRMRGLAA